MSQEAFRRHWRATHAPLVVQLPDIRRLVLNHPLPSADEATPVYDGVAEQWYDTADAAHTALASPEIQAAFADAPNFHDVDALQMLIVEEEEVSIPAIQAARAGK